MKYCKTSPCNNCPYRKDAPLQHWAKEEFENLIQKDSEQIGSVFACHKKDGHVCVGWLMDQDKRRLPSIALRLSLSKNEVSTDYLDSLNCKSEMFNNISDMVKANYPAIKGLKYNVNKDCWEKWK